MSRVFVLLMGLPLLLTADVTEDVVGGWLDALLVLAEAADATS